MYEVRKALQDALPNGLKVIEPLSGSTAIGIGGLADYYYEATGRDDLLRAVEAARSAKVPYFILGSGTSILISDAGFHGFVIKNSYEGIKDIATDQAGWIDVEVASGTSLAKLVRFTIDKNYTGLEGLVGLSGTVGGAVISNAKQRGVSISEFIENVVVLDEFGRKKIYRADECEFEYMNSVFQRKRSIVTEARLRLKQSSAGVISAKTRQALEGSKQNPNLPLIMPMFQDLENEEPDKFITGVGMNGHREGGAVILEEYPNYIQNLGHATSENVVALVGRVFDEVKKKYRTELKAAFSYITPDSFS